MIYVVPFLAKLNSPGGHTARKGESHRSEHLRCPAARELHSSRETAGLSLPVCLFPLCKLICVRVRLSSLGGSAISLDGSIWFYFLFFALYLIKEYVCLFMRFPILGGSGKKKILIAYVNVCLVSFRPIVGRDCLFKNTNKLLHLNSACILYRYVHFQTTCRSHCPDYLAREFRTRGRLIQLTLCVF